MKWFVIYKVRKNGNYYRRQGFISDDHYSELCADPNYTIVAATRCENK